MALTISTTLTNQQGIELTNSYGRVAVMNAYKGDTLSYSVELFASQSAFESGAQPFYPNFSVILGEDVPYDYATDSKDILDLAHDKAIQLLAAQGISATKSL